jgi:gliding motility-associated-like protein
LNSARFFRRIFLCLFLFVTAVQAQVMKFPVRQTNGQIHLVDFTTGIPTVTLPMPGYGTTASIDYEDVNIMTDVNNNLLFTSCVYGNDSIEVRDSNWAVMPNGNGLLGNSSCLQSGLVRIPCSTNKYFFIHTTANPNNLYYSVVDMSLNGGLGDVVQKNTFVATNIGEGKTISHQLPTGCRWLLTPRYVNDTTFEVVRFLINDIGIGPPVAIATVNLSAIPFLLAMEVELSPDNSKLSMSTLRSNPSDPDIIIWDFDLLSGTLSNRVDWSVSTDPILGTEWSPDNTKVYFCGNISTNFSDFGRINLTTATVDIIDAAMGRYIMDIEKAGNGKIYIAPNYNQNYLAEVANPNDNNVANIGYVHNAVYISSTGCRSPLPSAIDGEPPGTTTTPQFIWFEANSTTNCNEYTFRDSSCLGTWWEWNFGDGNYSNSEFVTHQYLNSGTYDITLRMVACGDTLTLTKSNYITVNVNQTTASFQSATQFCEGSQVSFTNTSTNATGYYWDFGDATSDTAVNPVHTYADTGTYVITLIATGTTGCEDTTQLTISILINPVSSFTAVIDTCALSVAFQNTSLNSSTYAWTFGDQSTSTQQNPSHQYAGAGSYTIGLIVSSGSGCIDTSLNMTVDLPLQPIANFTSQILNCDSVATFTVQSQNSNSQLWNFGDGTADTSAIVTHTFHSTGNQIITLISYNQFGCSDTTTQSLDVIQTPVSNFLVTEDTCNQNVSFQNTSLLADGYSWNFGDASTSNQQDPVHHYSNDGSYTITLIASNDGVCFDTSSLSVTLIPLPVAAFSFQIPDCDTYVQFTNLSLNSGSVLWSISDGTTYQVNDPLHQFLTMGQFEVTLTAYSPVTSCSNTLMQTVNLVPVPTASFSLQIDTCAQTIVATNTSANASNYSWYFSDGANETSESVTHLFPGGGNGYVQLVATNINFCADSITTFFSIPPAPVSNFTWTQMLCDSVVNFIEQCANEVSYNWNFGDGNTSSAATPTHTYGMGGIIPVQLISTSAYGCVDTIENILNLVINTPANFSVVIDSCAGNAIFLNQAPLAATYDWNFDQIAAATTPNAVFSFPTNDLYIITLTVNKGTPCEAHRQEQINYYVNDGERVYIPNSFTPNDDGLNDLFKIDNRVPCDNYSIDIFDRWGAEIFHADDALTDFWDGTYKSDRAPEGVYVYLLKGSSSKKVGHVLLIK